MNLLFTICARAGSKGLKNKNISTFLEHPLPYYTVSAIDLFMKSHQNEYGTITIAVNTDSNELIKMLNKTKMQFLYIPRKPEFATDTAAKLDVIKDTLKECEADNQIKYDMLIDLDLTSPLRALRDIENAVKKLRENDACDLVFSVTDSRRNPYFNIVTEENGFYKKVIDSNFTARQQAPSVFDMNASIYAYHTDFLRRVDKPGIFDGKALTIKMLDTAVLDIDSEEDFEIMQILASYFYRQNKELNAIKNNIDQC